MVCQMQSFSWSFTRFNMFLLCCFILFLRAEAKEQVDGYSNGYCRKFSSREDAEKFLKQKLESAPPVQLNCGVTQAAPAFQKASSPPETQVEILSLPVVLKCPASTPASQLKPISSAQDLQWDQNGYLLCFIEGSSNFSHFSNQVGSAGIGVYFAQGDAM